MSHAAPEGAGSQNFLHTPFYLSTTKESNDPQKRPDSLQGGEGHRHQFHEDEYGPIAGSSE